MIYREIRTLFADELPQYTGRFMLTWLVIGSIHHLVNMVKLDD